MQFLIDLWLPILVASLAVFFVSSLVHMVLGYHNSDYRGLPGEDAIFEAFRKAGAGPGDYFLPYCTSMKDLADPEVVKKFEQGPVGFLTLRPPGPPAMGAQLLQWFLYTVLVSICVAYVADFTLAGGASFSAVLRVTGTVATLVYGLGHAPSSIWKGVAWSTSVKFLIDGILYGVATGAVFGWLWPA